ncbi:MAG: hypothetical protein JO303_14425 [Caulobacteraceae bacterium]|nr:hypothetical protein [Caulobacteraceae bacterium]
MSRSPGSGGPSRLPAVFWVMMAFAAACILSGAVIGFFGPRLFPVHAPAPVHAGART